VGVGVLEGGGVMVSDGSRIGVSINNVVVVCVAVGRSVEGSVAVLPVIGMIDSNGINAD
jgi:hypothetical protein